MINKITSEITTRWGAFGGILGKEFKLSLSPWIQFSPSTQEQTTENWWTECVAGSHWARFTVWELSCTQTHPTDSNSGRRPSSKLVRHLTGLASISVSIGSTQQLIWIWSLCPLPFSISFLYYLSTHSQSTRKKITLTFACPPSPAGSYCFLAELSWQKTAKHPGWFLPHGMKLYITAWPMWQSHQANTSTLDVEQIRKCVSWAGGRMVEFWVTVSPWTSHVLNALGVDEYLIAWLKVNKAYGKT